VTRDHKEWLALLEQQDLRDLRARNEVRETRVTRATQDLQALLGLLERLGQLALQGHKVLKEFQDPPGLKDPRVQQVLKELQERLARLDLKVLQELRVQLAYQETSPN